MKTSTSRIAVKNVGSKNNGTNLLLKCSDCIHFDGVAHPELKKPCKDLGKKPYAHSCDLMNPNAARMSRALGSMEAVLDIISTMSESDIRLLALTAIRAKELVKYTKFTYGQKVYFNLSAPYTDYIDSYYCGVVIGYIEPANQSGEGYLHIAGTLSSDQGSSITLPVSSVLTQKQWDKHYRKLFTSNKFYTPESNRLRFECSEPTNPDDDYEVPNLDMSAEQLKTLAATKKKGRGKHINESALETFKDKSHNPEYDDEDYNEDAEEIKPKSKGKSKKSGTTVYTLD